LTDDPFSWRTDHYHAGLDIGDPVRPWETSAARDQIERDPVKAVADGMLRLFNYELGGHTVLYCHGDEPMHERFRIPEDKGGSAWWDGERLYTGARLGDDHVFCDHVITASSGRAILIAHTLPDGSSVVTKYAHLKEGSIPDEILLQLVDDVACFDPPPPPDSLLPQPPECNVDSSRAAAVTRGQVIGAVGNSYKGSEDGFEDVHLHFELRRFTKPAPPDDSWYKMADVCANGIDLEGRDCTWSESTGRQMETVLDVEGYLPPLPASWAPRDPAGGILRDEHNEPGEIYEIRRRHPDAQVVAVKETSARRRSGRDALVLTLSIGIWRPDFYSQYRDQPPRTSTHGIAGTGPGVDSYYTNATCADPVSERAAGPITGDPERAGELPRQERTIELAPGQSCTVTVRASNQHWEEEHPGEVLDRADQNIELRDPTAAISVKQVLAVGALEAGDSLIDGELLGLGFDFYPFTAYRGVAYTFCTDLTDDDDDACQAETDEKAAVIELWGPDGAEAPLAGPLSGGAARLRWTRPTTDPDPQPKTYFVLVRQRLRSADGPPPDQSYTLRYSVPSVDPCITAAIFGTQIACIPLIPLISAPTSVTPNSISFSWSESAGAASYEVRLDGDDATKAVYSAAQDAAPGSAQPRSGAGRSHSFGGLEPDTEYELEVRAPPHTSCAWTGTMRRSKRPITARRAPIPSTTWTRMRTTRSKCGPRTPAAFRPGPARLPSTRAWRRRPGSASAAFPAAASL